MGAHRQIHLSCPASVALLVAALCGGGAVQTCLSFILQVQEVAITEEDHRGL